MSPDQQVDRVDVLVVGDANPDLILAGDVVPRFGQAEQLLDRAELVLGGSGSIMAAGLARLGVATGMTAVVGEDVFGQLVLDRLSARGVDVSGVVVDPGTPTGLSVILVGGDDDRAILTLLGTVSELDAGHVLARVEAAAPRHVHLASYFLQPALARALPVLLDELRNRGVTTSLDTNWDPAERWAGLGEVLPRIDVLLPNQAEVLAIAGALGFEVGDAPAAARALTTYGCRVVVKCGADGALSVGPDSVVTRVAGPQVAVVDTTGAGDSFDAGYLAALLDGVGDETERLRWATVAGALSVRAGGGTAGQATRGELDAWLAGEARTS